MIKMIYTDGIEKNRTNVLFWIGEIDYGRQNSASCGYELFLCQRGDVTSSADAACADGSRR